MSTTRPETVTDGLTHRHGCTAPSALVTPSHLRGWNIRRCPECGAAGLARTTTQKEPNR